MVQRVRPGYQRDERAGSPVRVVDRCVVDAAEGFELVVVVEAGVEFGRIRPLAVFLFLFLFVFVFLFIPPLVPVFIAVVVRLEVERAAGYHRARPRDVLELRRRRPRVAARDCEGVKVFAA